MAPAIGNADILNVVVLAGQSVAVGGARGMDVALDFPMLWQQQEDENAPRQWKDILVVQSQELVDQNEHDYSGSRMQGPLTVGFGAAQDLFGPELGFGYEWMLQHAEQQKEQEQDIQNYSKNKLVIIKAAASGSLSHEWRPPSPLDSNPASSTGEYYRAMMKTIQATLYHLKHAIPNDQQNQHPLQIHLAGLIWMTGYEDVFEEDRRREYETHLRDLIQRVRIDLERPHLPILISALPPSLGGSDEERQIGALQRHLVDSLQDSNIQVADWEIPAGFLKPSLGGDRFHVLDRPQVMLSWGRQLAQHFLELVHPEDNSHFATSHRQLQNAKSYSILLDLMLSPSNLVNNDCNAFLATVVQDAYNGAAGCADTNDDSCPTMTSAQVNTDLLTLLELASAGILAGFVTQEFSIRFDVVVECTGCTLGDALLTDDDGGVSATALETAMNTELLEQIAHPCLGSLTPLVDQIQNLVQTDNCGSMVTPVQQAYQVVLRFSNDQDVGLTDETVQNEYRSRINELMVATYNEINALNPAICDPLHFEAFVDLSAEPQDGGTVDNTRRRQRVLRKLDKSASSSASGSNKQIKNQSEPKSLKSGFETKGPSSVKSSKSPTGSIKSSKGPATPGTTALKSDASPSTKGGASALKSTKGPSSSSSSNKSTKSIKSDNGPTDFPTESPRADPVPGIPGAIALNDGFEVSCIGDDCMESGIFEDADGDAMMRRRTAAVTPEEDCLCPQDALLAASDGDVRGPFQDEFQGLFQDIFATLQANGEFSELVCAKPEFPFGAFVALNVTVENGQVPTDEQLRMVGQTYLEEYNRLNIFESCDPQTRVLEDFNVNGFIQAAVDGIDAALAGDGDMTNITIDADMEDDPFGGGGFSTFTAYYSYRGACTNCRGGLGNGGNLFGDDVTGNRRLSSHTSVADTCLCVDPSLGILTEERFTTETQQVFDTLLTSFGFPVFNFLNDLDFVGGVVVDVVFDNFPILPTFIGGILGIFGL